MRYPKKSFTQIYREWRRHAGAHPDGHQDGRRKPTETSVSELFCKILEEQINIKVTLFLTTHELFRKENPPTPASKSLF